MGRFVSHIPDEITQEKPCGLESSYLKPILGMVQEECFAPCEESHHDSMKAKKNKGSSYTCKWKYAWARKLHRLHIFWQLIVYGCISSPPPGIINSQSAPWKKKGDISSHTFWECYKEGPVTGIKTSCLIKWNFGKKRRSSRCIK